jgi:hypothetical protein
LYVHAISGTPDVRRAALVALAEACIVAAGIARPLGNGELSTLAAKRATEAAALTDRPDLVSLSGMTRVGALVRLGARHRARTVLASELAACRVADVAAGLPGLIRDVHTTLGTGRDHDELLELAVYLHAHITRWFLINAGGPPDLLRRTVFLARRLAQQRDEVATLAMATFSTADVLLASGAFQLGQAELNSITLPPTTADTAGLASLVTASHAVAASLTGRPSDVAAPMDAAAELAERFGVTGEVDSLGYVFGPVDLGLHRMALALETGEPDRAVSIARQVNPERHPFPVNRSYYWVHYGQALARVRRGQNDAVAALRTAEDIFPARVHRDPMVRDVIAGLLARSRRDSPMDRQLRGMAYRAGLPV